MSAIILGISTVLQFIAALLSVRLIQITGKWRAWTLIAVAMTLMGVRRSITLYRTTIGDIVHTADLAAELVALTISILMVSGVLLIGPIFRKIHLTNNILLFKQFSIDNTHCAIYWLDSNFRFTDVNDATCKMLGYTREELLDMQVCNIDNIFPVDDWQEWKTQSTSIFESRHRTKNGQLIPVEIRASYFSFEGNESICAFVSDITERKQADKALRENEKKYRGLLETSPDGMVIVNAKGEIEIINQQLQKLTGYTPDDLTGQPVEILIPERFISHKQKRESYLASPHARFMGEGLELSVRRKDGSEFPAEISLSPLEMADGLRVSTAIRDISERRKAEEVIKKSETMLAEAQRIAHVGSWEVDVPANRRVWSDEMCRIFEVDSGASIDSYEAYLELVHTDDRARFDQVYADAINDNKQHYDIEHRLLMKDGRVKHIHQICENIFNENGELVRCIGTVIDITERKRAEKEITRFARIFEDSLNEIYLFDADSLIFVQMNSAAQQNLGYTKEELRELTPLDLKPEFTSESFAELIAPLRKGEKEKIAFETVHIRKDKSLYDVEVHLQLLQHDHEALFAAIAMDITERKQAEEELKKLSRAVEASSSSVVITDIDGNIEYINPRFTETTGYTREEAMGQNPRFLLQSEDASDSLYDDIARSIASKGEWKGEFHNRRKDGSYYWDRCSISCVKDATGEITHYIGIQDDVTHEYELAEQLSYQASHDALTGLANRREFERRAERLLATLRQNKGEHALCFMDLDQFKVVNDTCGHIAGDELLRQLSMILKQEVRKSDALARLGGDEFGVLMEHCSLDHAHRVATSLQKAVRDYQFAWEGNIFKVGVSMGLVAITEALPNLTELLKQADAACYMAKDLGRNRIHVYHGEDKSLARRHGEMQWVARLNQAFEEDRFCLYAQSIVPLDGGTDKHYELLIRMVDVKGKIIPPGAFLPAAEHYNLIVQLDRWVIENAFSLLAAHPVFLEKIQFISINMSGQSLADESFLDFVIKQLYDTGVAGEKVCFEITETAAITNLSTANLFISKMNVLGCRFALDDFGSGLSSFAYLKNLPVDYLKIDGMFVKDIADDPIDHAMVKSINEIGQVMGMQTIAEFVENDEIKGMLREIGVNYAQGYGIDKPQSFDELLGKAT